MSRTVSGQTGNSDRDSGAELKPTRVLLYEDQREWLTEAGKRRHQSMSAHLRSLVDDARTAERVAHEKDAA